MKNTKIISVIIVLALAFTLLSACGSDPIKDDLTNYIQNEVPALQALDSKAKDVFMAHVANATDNATTLADLNDTIIPASNDAIAAAKKVVPATKELAAIHDQYVTYLTTENSGYVKLADVITNDSGEAEAANANDLLKTAQSQDDAYLAALKALGKDHGLDVKLK